MFPFTWFFQMLGTAVQSSSGKVGGQRVGGDDR